MIGNELAWWKRERVNLIIVVQNNQSKQHSSLALGVLEDIYCICTWCCILYTYWVSTLYAICCPVSSVKAPSRIRRNSEV